jgi:hypothetical protein
MSLLKSINVTLSLLDDEIALARKHAKAFADSRIYPDSGQIDREKIEKDAYQGKLAEFAVKRYLESKGCKVIGPDLEIYPPKLRSWEFDLKCIYEGKEWHISVKSTNDRYDPSWIFQADNNGRYDKSLQDPETIVVCCLITGGGYAATLCFHLSADKVKALWGEPRRDNLKGKKKALYKRTVEEYMKRQM